MQPIVVPNPVVIGSARGPRIIAPPTRPDDLYEKLREVFKDDDARHILNAVRAKCDYFLTLDRKTILRPAELHAPTVAVLCGSLRFVSPAELMRTHGAESARSAVS